jgi:hypothetical protein
MKKHESTFPLILKSKMHRHCIKVDTPVKDYFYRKIISGDRGS